MRSPERGSALALALVLAGLIAGLGAALSSVSLAQNKTSSESNDLVALSYAAEASLEKAVLFVNTSDYDFNGNQWLNGNSPENSVVPPNRVDPRRPAAGDTPVFTEFIGNPLVADTVVNAKTRVEVFVYALDTLRRDFRLMARAVRGNSTLILAQDVSAWDSFARFATFADSEALSFGATSVKGHVHSNVGINFFYGGATFSDEVTTVNGFQYYDGANAGNTRIGSPDPHTSPIPMPSLGDVEAMRGSAAGMLDVSGHNFQYGNLGDKMNAEIVFSGDQVTIRATNRTTGATLQGTYTIPPDGIIYVDGDITSIKGSMSTRATVSTTGSIKITDNLRYVDGNGTPAYKLTLNGSGVANNQTDPGIAWTTANGYDYVPDPTFAPQNGIPTLGLMAAERIAIAPDAPRNLEIHSSLFSLHQSWSADLTTSKENLRIVGSIATKMAGSRAQGAMGYAASGGYIYEETLRQNPPPGWVKVRKPFWRPRWKTI